MPKSEGKTQNKGEKQISKSTEYKEDRKREEEKKGRRERGKKTEAERKHKISPKYTSHYKHCRLTKKKTPIKRQRLIYYIRKPNTNSREGEGRKA
jgi:hypothetical protein